MSEGGALEMGVLEKTAAELIGGTKCHVEKA